MSEAEISADLICLYNVLEAVGQSRRSQLNLQGNPISGGTRANMSGLDPVVKSSIVGKPETDHSFTVPPSGLVGS